MSLTCYCTFYNIYKKKGFYSQKWLQVEGEGGEVRQRAKNLKRLYRAYRIALVEKKKKKVFGLIYTR